MKITTLMMFVCTINVTASVYSQNAKLTLDLQNTTMREVLKAIESQSNFRFFYNDEFLDLDKTVDIKIKEKQIEEVINVLMADSDISFRVLDNDLIVFTPKDIRQQAVVTGTVTDAETGEPLAGVYVRIQGTNTGGVTDVDGKYSVAITGSDVVIQFSFVGYVTETIPVEDRSVIDVILKSEPTTLDEVVVIGYGTTTRRNFTGSVSNVKLSDSPVANTTTTNAFELLNGLVPGVTQSQSGEAGSSTSLLIRGQKSLDNAATRPLIVVDGLIFSGSINDIDPAIVESISTLKDATSLAAYGSMAANGVIMVTTKKGIKGKPMINISMSTAFSKPNYKPEMRSPQSYIDYMDYKNEGGESLSWMSGLEMANYDANSPTDWYKLITRTGVVQNYSASVSGAGDNMDYFLSASYLDNKNFIVADKFNRSTFSARANTKINNYISIGANINLSSTKNDGVRPNYGAAVTLSPWAEPYLSDGRWRKYADGREETTINALWDTYNGIDAENHRNSVVVGGNLEIKLPWIEGLSYKITGSFTRSNSTLRRFTHETNYVNMTLGEDGYTAANQAQYLSDASGYINDTKDIAWVLDNILTYTTSFGKHFINATLVYTRDSRHSDIYRFSGTNFEALGNTNLGFDGLNYATTQQVDNITYSMHNDVGYLARANYSYNNTYHINASIRRDGSSVFGSDNRWGVFPAIGLAYTITNEPFMSSIKSVVDNLKLKASWGKNGNQSLEPYGTLSRMDVGRAGLIGYLFDDVIYYGQSMSTLGNNELGWEETQAWNFGIEGDVLHSRIHLEVDVYKSKTTNQIFSRTIPVMAAGITSMSATIGRIDNWGIEATLNTVNVKSGDWLWTTNFVYSMNRNKLVDLFGDGKDNIPDRLFLGEPLYPYYGRKWIGVVQEDDTEYLAANGGQPGDAKYANLDGSADGRITDDDMTILGYNQENFRISMQNTISYKNIQLYFMFNGVFSGNDYGMAQNNSAYLTGDGFQYHNTLEHPYWTEENQSNKYPSETYGSQYFIALQPYGFVRLQEANISYNIPNKILDKVGVTNMRVFVSGSNLFFIAPKWEFSDPEIRSFSAAQLPRTYTFGINLTF